MTFCKDCKNHFVTPIYGSSSFDGIGHSYQAKIGEKHGCKANPILPYTAMDYVVGRTRWTYDGVTFLEGDSGDPNPGAKYPQDPYTFNRTGHCPLFLLDPNAATETVWGVEVKP